MTRRPKEAATDRRYRIIELHVIHGLRAAVIAERLSLSAGHVRKVLSAAGALVPYGSQLADGGPDVCHSGGGNRDAA